MILIFFFPFLFLLLLILQNKTKQNKNVVLHLLLTVLRWHCVWLLSVAMDDPLKRFLRDARDVSETLDQHTT